jgi:hypothetical protein
LNKMARQIKSSPIKVRPKRPAISPMARSQHARPEGHFGRTPKCTACQCVGLGDARVTRPGLGSVSSGTGGSPRRRARTAVVRVFPQLQSDCFPPNLNPRRVRGAWTCQFVAVEELLPFAFACRLQSLRRGEGFEWGLVWLLVWRPARGSLSRRPARILPRGAGRAGVIIYFLP